MSKNKETPSDLLTPKDLIARYKNKISRQTLYNWNSIGCGPKPTKIGAKVFYKLSNVVAWESKRTRAR